MAGAGYIAYLRREALQRTMRWTHVRKAHVCEGLKHEAVTLEDLRNVHGLEASEIAAWMALYRRGGSEALKLRRHGGLAVAS
jgi:hypothetical protein